MSIGKISLILVHLARNRRGSVAVLASTTFANPDLSMQMQGTALLFGYCSGIVSRISIWPWIA